MNYTYLLECSDGTLYCGWTNDLEKRVKAHNSGRGAKYTKSRRPVRLVWYETFETKEEDLPILPCSPYQFASFPWTKAFLLL